MKKKLKLIYNAKEQGAPEAEARSLSLLNVCVFAALLFFAIKFPMCFNTNNPEELRDFDHYVRMAQGELAYRDFVWLYGPVSPLVYGTVLKIFPQTLLTVRIFSFCLWMVAVVFLTLLFARYFRSYASILTGTCLASSSFGYPSYSHNHVLVAVCLIISAYYFLRFMEDHREKDLILSFFAVSVCLFTRPVVTGYGLFAGWLIWLGSQKKYPDRWRMMVAFLAGTGMMTLFFFLIYGLPLIHAFYPRPWAILERKGYPNLHPIFALTSLFHAPSIESALKQIRAAIETSIFYLHYFVWPTFVFTLASVLRYRTTYRTAALCTSLAWVASFDLLHYGFVDPMQEQAMLVRGQYFFALTAASVFILFWPLVLSWKEHKLKSAAVAFGLSVLGLWGLFPWGTGLYHLTHFETNPYHFRILEGVLAHPDRSAIFEAATFTNSLCSSHDSVVIPQYDPGVQYLLKCRDLFSKDAYLFTRMPWYVLSPGETPYSPGGNITNGELIQRIIAEVKPKFFITQGDAQWDKFCKAEGWQTKDFGHGSDVRRVCWQSAPPASSRNPSSDD